MARKKTPTALKVIRGTDQPCRTNYDEAKYEALTKVSIPKVLSSSRARKIFKDKSTQLIRQGILQAPDIDLLTAYCNTYDIFLQAVEALNDPENDLVVKVVTKKGEMQMISPYLQIQKQLIPLLNSLSSQFGFSPSARAGLKLEPKKKENELDKFLNS